MKKLLLLALMARLVFGAGLDSELIQLRIENKILKATLERCAQELNATKAAGTKQEATKNKREIKFDEKIIIDNVLEFEIQKIFFAKQIKPSNLTKSGYYSYYPSKNDETTMFATILKLKSLSADNLDLRKIVNATLIYDNKFKYSLKLAEEKADGSDFEQHMFTMDVKPLIKSTIYALSEVPLELEVSDKPINVIIEIQDQSFNLKVR